MTAVGIQNVVQDIHMVQHSTGTLGHAVQRVLSHMDIDAGLALNELVEAAQQCAAAGQGDAVVDDVGRQFRWSTLKRHSSRASRTSSEWTTTFLGRPSTRLRPLISRVISGSIG